MEEIEKAKDRLEVLERIKEMEKNGIFDIDADLNLPTIELLPNKNRTYVHYTSSRLVSSDRPSAS